MDRYAIVENDLIVNVIVADADFIAAHYPGAIVCPDFVGVGDKYENGIFSRNTPVVDEA